MMDNEAMTDPQGWESNILSHLQYKLRHRMSPPGRVLQEERQVSKGDNATPSDRLYKSSLISLTKPDYIEVKGHLVGNVHLSLI